MFKQGDQVRVKNEPSLGTTAGMLGEVVTTADDERGHMIIVAIPDYPHPLLGKSRQALAFTEDELEREE